MVECIDIGSYVVTVVVMMHGAVIELNIPHWKQYILQNVNLLSLAGDFSEVGLGDNAVRASHLNRLNEMFQQDLNKETITVMQTAAERIRPAYINYIKSFFDGELSTENSCKIFDNIQIDKALGTGMEGFFDRIMQCILPDVIGIYVISVHKKIDTNTLNLIYPKDKSRPKLNLLERADLIKFAKIFNTDGESMIQRLQNASTPWQPISSISMTDENQMEQIQNWKVTMSSSGNISHIRLSYLIFIIKEIVGDDKCKLNIIDYSCSPIAEFISAAEMTNARYMQARDIENIKQPFGGKNTRNKRRTNRQYAKKRYTKKRNRKNKNTNNPIQKKQHKNT